MATSRRTFTKKFKQDVVRQSEHCEKITELASDLGLPPELVYRWRAELRANPQGSFPGRGIPTRTPEEEQTARLKAELADVRIQRDPPVVGEPPARQVRRSRFGDRTNGPCRRNPPLVPLPRRGDSGFPDRCSLRRGNKFPR